MARGEVSKTTYERMTKLTEDGLSMADAVRKVAQEDGKKEGAVRANFYNHRRKLEGSNATPRPRGRLARTTTSPDDAVREAIRLLQEAHDSLDAEVEEARRKRDAAQAHLDQLEASVKERKADLERKIKALS